MLQFATSWSTPSTNGEIWQLVTDERVGIGKSQLK
jgi:hypothetical protein